MDNTKDSTKTILRSNEVIDLILLALGLTRETLSTYKDYAFDNGRYIRLRISDHGLFLQNWFNINKERRSISPSVPKLNCGQNLAITFAPNQEECIEKCIPFPPKIKNVTKAKTESGNNVKPQFTVRHICYFTWELSISDISIITSSILKCVSEGELYNEPLKDITRMIEWEDTSNLPPKRITTTTKTTKLEDEN